MTSKERARLRGLANGIETVLQIGKDGIGENLIRQADITLEARELIKGRVLDGCMDYTSRTAAEALAQATGSEVIQVIGSKFVLYRKKKTVETDGKASKPRKVRHQRTNKRESVNRPESRPGERKPPQAKRFWKRDERRKPERFGTRNGERKPLRTNCDEQRKPLRANCDEQRKPSRANRPEQRKPLRTNRFGERKAVQSGAAPHAQRNAARPGQARNAVRRGRARGVADGNRNRRK